MLFSSQTCEVYTHIHACIHTIIYIPLNVFFILQILFCIQQEIFLARCLWLKRLYCYLLSRQRSRRLRFRARPRQICQETLSQKNTSHKRAGGRKKEIFLMNRQDSNVCWITGFIACLALLSATISHGSCVN
jgi:hypothetical protein